MSDAIQPVEYVIFGLDADGNFIMDVQPDDEMKARALVSKGTDVLNQFYRNKLAQAMLAEAQQKRIVNPRNGRVN